MASDFCYIFCSFFINFKTNASESIYYIWFTQTSISVHEYFHYEFYPLSHNTVCCIYVLCNIVYYILMILAIHKSNVIILYYYMCQVIIKGDIREEVKCNCTMLQCRTVY